MSRVSRNVIQVYLSSFHNIYRIFLPGLMRFIKVQLCHIANVSERIQLNLALSNRPCQQGLEQRLRRIGSLGDRVLQLFSLHVNLLESDVRGSLFLIAAGFFIVGKDTEVGLGRRRHCRIRRHFTELLCQRSFLSGSSELFVDGSDFFR